MIRTLYIILLTTVLLWQTAAVAETKNSQTQAESRLTLATQAVSTRDFSRAETLLDEYLQQNPDDIDARFLLARVLSWQQKWPQALTSFDVLLAEKPDNTDFLLARANTLAWMGRHDEALQDLDKARQLSPGYSVIWQTQITLLDKQDTPAASNRASRLRHEARQRFPDQNWERPAVIVENKTVARNGYAVEGSYGHDNLSNGRSPWSIASLKLLAQTPAKHFAHLQLDRFERFDLVDQQIGGSYALPIADDWAFYAGATYSPSHEVIANRMLTGKLSRSFSNGLNLHAGISHAKYSKTDSQQLYLTGEYYWSTYRAAYTYRLIDVKNAGTGDNHNIQFNRFYGATSFVGASYARGRDVEFDGTANPPISDVMTLSIYGRHAIQPRWSLIYSLIHHKQGDFYDRNGFVLGLRYDL